MLAYPLAQLSVFEWLGYQEVTVPMKREMLMARMKFDEKGRRVGAGLAIIQWQNGVPVTVYPPEAAVSQPIWPKK